MTLLELGLYGEISMTSHTSPRLGRLVGLRILRASKRSPPAFTCAGATFLPPRPNHCWSRGAQSPGVTTATSSSTTTAQIASAQYLPLVMISHVASRPRSNVSQAARSFSFFIRTALRRPLPQRRGKEAALLL